jgi:hypothetical protein
MGIKILFRGLFCHFTDTNTVVIIDAFKHDLRLTARAVDVVSAAGFATDGVFAKTGETSFKIGKHILKLSGTTAAPTTRTPEFINQVPSLRKHTNCSNVRTDVASKKLASHIAGYLVHSGGAYSVADFFPLMVTFNGKDDDAACIARTVLLELNGSSDVTIGDAAAHVTIRNGSTVNFTNAVDGLGLPNEHFHHYFHAIFDGCTGGDQPRSVASKECHPGHPPNAFPGADCANSHNP